MKDPLSCESVIDFQYWWSKIYIEVNDRFIVAQKIDIINAL